MLFGGVFKRGRVDGQRSSKGEGDSSCSPRQTATNAAHKQQQSSAPTTDGVTVSPSALGMHTGAPLTTRATAELVVPRSMPTTSSLAGGGVEVGPPPPPPPRGAAAAAAGGGVRRCSRGRLAAKLLSILLLLLLLMPQRAGVLRMFCANMFCVCVRRRQNARARQETGGRACASLVSAPVLCRCNGPPLALASAYTMQQYFSYITAT
jgi:hypothetical protein